MTAAQDNNYNQYHYVIHKHMLRTNFLNDENHTTRKRKKSYKKRSLISTSPKSTNSLFKKKQGKGQQTAKFSGHRFIIWWSNTLSMYLLLSSEARWNHENRFRYHYQVWRETTQSRHSNPIIFIKQFSSVSIKIQADVSGHDSLHICFFKNSDLKKL